MAERQKEPARLDERVAPRPLDPVDGLRTLLRVDAQSVAAGPESGNGDAARPRGTSQPKH
jgi:hypothetical protein